MTNDIDTLLALVDALTADVAAWTARLDSIDTVMRAQARSLALLTANDAPKSIAALTVARAKIEGHYPYRWREKDGKEHIVTNIVGGNSTNEYEIWFDPIDPDGWAVVQGWAIVQGDDRLFPAANDADALS